MKTINEFKPCPFCGGTAKLWNVIYESLGQIIECDNCKVKVWFSDAKTDEQAINGWNRRVRDE